LDNAAFHFLLAKSLRTNILLSIILGLHRIWFFQIRPGPDLGLRIRPVPGPGMERNVL